MYIPVCKDDYLGCLNLIAIFSFQLREWSMTNRLVKFTCD